eukprot:15337567-Ditylum_brightwellii.AAC.1
MQDSVITAPHTTPQHRLGSAHFKIALCQCLHLPIHQKQLLCKCSKKLTSMVIITLTAASTVNSGYTTSQEIYTAGVAISSSNVVREPAKVSQLFPGVRPIDTGFDSIVGLKGLDITITGTPPAANTPTKQVQASLHMHTTKEVLKWCETACPNKLKAQAAGTKVELSQGHAIINEMLHHGIHMLPATIDLFGCEGPALHWFKFAHPRSVFHTTDHNFGKAKGSAVGKEMCCQATQDDYMKGLLLKADRHWKV